MKKEELNLLEELFEAKNELLNLYQKLYFNHENLSLKDKIKFKEIEIERIKKEIIKYD